MSSESSEPFVARPLQIQHPPLEVIQAPSQERPAPSEEEVRLADAVFVKKNQEAETAAGLMGLWTGGMVLKDILQDALTPPADEEEEKPKKKKQEK